MSFSCNHHYLSNLKFPNFFFHSDLTFFLSAPKSPSFSMPTSTTTSFAVTNSSVSDFDSAVSNPTTTLLSPTPSDLKPSRTSYGLSSTITSLPSPPPPWASPLHRTPKSLLENPNSRARSRPLDQITAAVSVVFDEDEKAKVKAVRHLVTRGRRFVVKDEDSNIDWAVLESSRDEEDEQEAEDDDVVRRVLQKCAKILTELKRELHGSLVTTMSNRYAEVDTSSVGIVTQVVSNLCLGLLGMI